MSTRRTPRLAVHPIAYRMRGGRIDRSRGVLEEALADFSADRSALCIDNLGSVEPSIDDRFESSRRSHAWAMRALPFLA